MAFWTSQRLQSRLATLFPGGERPYIDCNALTLTVAHEYYVSPKWSDDPSEHPIERLADGESLQIPPGQFAFLQTAEEVAIPRDAMGFISLKATYKLQGLINVSGFHIDPGWHGRLVFAVFNAGPSDVHLRQGMQLFLIWISSLDGESDKYREKKNDADHFVKTVNLASGPIKSGYDVAEKIERLEQRSEFNRTLLLLILGLIGTAFIRYIILPMP